MQSVLMWHERRAICIFSFTDRFNIMNPKYFIILKLKWPDFKWSTVPLDLFWYGFLKHLIVPSTTLLLATLTLQNLQKISLFWPFCFIWPLWRYFKHWLWCWWLINFRFEGVKPSVMNEPTIFFKSLYQTKRSGYFSVILILKQDLIKS